MDTKNISIESIKVEDRTPELILQLLDVWESSVQATHLFLSDDEIRNIKKYVPKYLKHIPILVIVKENNYPSAFMGISDNNLEMLFVKNEKRGQGIGKQLLTYGIQNYNVNHLTVNEQNPSAKAFYEHMGFVVYKRTDLDEESNPYPLLYMQK